MARYIDCKNGLHSYTLAVEVGGGISRRSCSECGLVQIDLGAETRLADTSLFTQSKLASMFEVEALLARAGDDFEMPTRSFGARPAQRRRPAQVFP